MDDCDDVTLPIVDISTTSGRSKRVKKSEVFI